MDRRSPVTIAVLAALALLLLCPGNAPALENGRPAPDFQLTDLGGVVQKLSDHRGKVVVLNFWATWCPECLIEIDPLSAFAEKYGKQGVVVLAVSLDKNEETLREFLAAHPVKFTVMMDREGDVFVKKYTIRGLPATIIIDRQGSISATMMGAQEFLSREFTSKIDPLLAR